MLDNEFDQYFRDRLLNHTSKIKISLWKKVHTNLIHHKVFHFWKWYFVTPSAVVVAFTGYLVVAKLNKPTRDNNASFGTTVAAAGKTAPATNPAANTPANTTAPATTLTDTPISTAAATALTDTAAMNASPATTTATSTSTAASTTAPASTTAATASVPTGATNSPGTKPAPSTPGVSASSTAVSNAAPSTSATRSKNESNAKHSKSESNNTHSTAAITRRSVASVAKISATTRTRTSGSSATHHRTFTLNNKTHIPDTESSRSHHRRTSHEAASDADVRASNGDARAVNAPHLIHPRFAGPMTLAPLSPKANIAAGTPNSKAKHELTLPAIHRYHPTPLQFDIFGSPEYYTWKTIGFSYSAGFRATVIYRDHWTFSTGIQYLRTNVNHVSLKDSLNGLTAGYIRHVQLPVLFGYTVGNQKFSMSANAGVIFSLSTYSNNLGNPNGESLYFGLGFASRVTRHLSIFAEPHIKCWMPPGDQRLPPQLWSTGLSVGVRVNF